MTNQGPQIWKYSSNEEGHSQWDLNFIPFKSSRTGQYTYTKISAAPLTDGTLLRIEDYLVKEDRNAIIGVHYERLEGMYIAQDDVTGKINLVSDSSVRMGFVDLLASGLELADDDYEDEEFDNEPEEEEEDETVNVYAQELTSEEEPVDESDQEEESSEPEEKLDVKDDDEEDDDDDDGKPQIQIVVDDDDDTEVDLEAAIQAAEERKQEYEAEDDSDADDEDDPEELQKVIDEVHEEDAREIRNAKASVEVAKQIQEKKEEVVASKRRIDEDSAYEDRYRYKGKDKKHKKKFKKNYGEDDNRKKERRHTNNNSDALVTPYSNIDMATIKRLLNN